MVASIRSLANCIGIGQQFSMLSDFFGFARGRLPSDPTGARVEVSLRRQVDRLRGKHFQLNVIAVGSDQFTDGDFLEIDYSIFKLRNIDDQVAMGVGRIQHWIVTTAEADGLDTPTSDDDLEQLTQDWTVPNDGIDMFVPHNMSVSSDGGTVLGMSPVNGPCDKDAKGMNGSTCGLWGSEQTARSFAHELGHYLGLDHQNGDHDNLMCQSSLANSIRNSVQLTGAQGNTMGGHCSVKPGC
jgi:Metallo-peptidase family M12B Reprolysin-like